MDSSAASNQPQHEHINQTVQKDVDKVVDKCDIEDISAKCDAASNKTVSYCRCWKSKKVCKDKQ